MNEEKLLPFCKCGCGKRVTQKWNKWLKGHHFRKKMPIEQRLAIAKAKLGVPLSKEHIAASLKGLIQYHIDNPEAAKEMSKIKIEYFKNNPEAIIAMSENAINQFSDPKVREEMSKILKNSKAAKIAAEKQRGGNDIVDHHVSYDFGRPKALTIKILRKFHSEIHHPKGCKFGTYGYSLID